MVAIQQGVGLLHGHTLAEVGGERTGHAQIRQRRGPPSDWVGLLLLYNDQYDRHCKFPALVDVFVVTEEPVAGGGRERRG